MVVELGYINGNFARIEFLHTGLLMIKVFMDASGLDFEGTSGSKCQKPII